MRGLLPIAAFATACLPDFRAVDGGGAPVVIEVAAGVAHACAVYSDGTLYCWGSNQFGEIGADPATTTTQCAQNNVEAAGAVAIACRPIPTKVPGIADAVHVSLGNAFTCVIHRTGGVSCFGLNAFSELGHPAGTGDALCSDGIGSSQSLWCNWTPTDIAGLTDVVQLAAGGYHACARTGNGAVSCWGDNTYAQLGVPKTTATTAGPLSPTGLASDIVDVSAGLFGGDTCVVRLSGQVWCWGLNLDGQLGFAVDTSTLCGTVPCVFAPTAAQTSLVAAGAGTPLSGFRRVWTGHYTTCAGDASDVVTCWGSRGFGLLADGTCGVNSIDPTPINASTNPVTDFVLRVGTSCAIDATGGRVCWGANDAYQVGEGSLGPSTCPFAESQTTPVRLGAPTNIERLAGGGDSFLALTTDKKVYAWGTNYGGNMGHDQGTNGDQSCIANATYCAPVPVLVPLP